MPKKKKRSSSGQPPKYETPQQLQSRIDQYFKSKARDTMPKTICGLVLYCGFSDRQSFYDNEKREGFSCTIKKARTRIEQHYETLLQKGLGAGAIFALKNFGWKDEYINKNENVEKKIILIMSKENQQDVSIIGDGRKLPEKIIL